MGFFSFSPFFGFVSIFFSLKLYFAGPMRTWVIGDSIVNWAGLTQVQLAGGGVVYWRGCVGRDLRASQTGSPDICRNERFRHPSSSIWALMISFMTLLGWCATESLKIWQELGKCYRIPE